MLETLTIALLGLLIGGLIVLVGFLALRRKGGPAATPRVQTQSMTQRVRTVGKLVGLEVHAKEIATSTKGWSWLPPILLSQARIAMIFHFEKQYAIDLARIRPSDVEELDPPDVGRPARYRLHLPPLEGSLRLTDVTPYDIQAGRILGLLDVIQMNAQTQGVLIRAAQTQAAELFQKNAERYEREARQSIERRLESFLRLFEANIEIVWSTAAPDAAEERVAISAELDERLHAAR